MNLKLETIKKILKDTDDRILHWEADAFPDDPTTYFRAMDNNFKYKISPEELVIYDHHGDYEDMITNKEVGTFMLCLYSVVSSMVFVPEDLEDRKLSDIDRF